MPTKTVKKSVKKTPTKRGVAEVALEKPARSTPLRVSSGMTVAHFNAKGEKQRVVSLSQDLFGQKVSPSLIAQAVRVYQANLRQGTQSTKTRGEVVGSTRKIYRQKGTGRARHGSIRAPIFVGGGIVFGPKPRDFSLKLPKKMKRQALVGALGLKANNGKLSVVSGLSDVSGKTRDMAQLIKKMDLVGKRLLVIIESNQDKAIRGVRNIKSVTIRPPTSVSALDVVGNDQILFAKEALDTFKKLSGKTIEKFSLKS